MSEIIQKLFYKNIFIVFTMRFLLITIFTFAILLCKDVQTAIFDFLDIYFFFSKYTVITIK